MDHAGTHTSVKPPPQPRTAAPIGTLPSVRVLVVEDEEVLRQVVVQVLKLHGYTVLEAAFGWDALEIWE